MAKRVPRAVADAAFDGIAARTKRATKMFTQDLLLGGRAPEAAMVTPVFPLGPFGTAFAAAANHARSEAIKVLLHPAGVLPALEAPAPKLLAPGV